KKLLFLDIQKKVRTRHGEEGLLGLAFHPEYKKNGLFFVNYTASHPRRTVVSRFKRKKENPLQADPNSEVVILEFRQPWGNHNGGCLAFGKDGMLYIGTGDGGSGGDPLNNGQRLNTLLGKILRIDINKRGGKKNYAIPRDNPFVNKKGARGEIWAYGLRNPWRFYIPSHGKFIWVADVGQNRIEEVSLVRKGGNYGWNLREGSLLFRKKKIPEGVHLEPPLWEYDHSLGNSITGGVVCHDPSLPALKGAYLCADFYSGRIWALWIQKKKSSKIKLKKVRVIHKSEINISSFGIDNRGRIFLLDYYNGRILALKPR
ncbi:MAG: glucose sorbosone dehydrogenase, partial [Planctomycetota bacterium]